MPWHQLLLSFKRCAVDYQHERMRPDQYAGSYQNAHTNPDADTNPDTHTNPDTDTVADIHSQADVYSSSDKHSPCNVDPATDSNHPSVYYTDPDTNTCTVGRVRQVLRYGHGLPIGSYLYHRICDASGLQEPDVPG